METSPSPLPTPRRRALRGPRLLVLAAGLAVVGLVAYVVMVAPPARPAASEPRLPAAPTSASSAAPSSPVPVVPELARTPTLGISANSVHELDDFIAATGTEPEVFDVFEPWSRGEPLERGLVDELTARGARLSITWEPWDPAGSHTHQPRYSLATIIAGDHDAYIDAFAASVGKVGSQVTIRLMHEMNGNWYPWGSGVNGNRDGEFVKAWQHVRERFISAGVTNVDWMWAPNALYPGAAPLAPLYPGDDLVDAVGLSNYNWGARTHDGFSTTWTDFGSLFDDSIAALRSLTSRPLWIAEVGSSDAGGSKAAWISEMLADVQQRPDVAGLIWFDHVDRAADVDWRIETEADAAAAWRAGFLARPAAG